MKKCTTHCQITFSKASQELGASNVTLTA